MLVLNVREGRNQGKKHPRLLISPRKAAQIGCENKHRVSADETLAHVMPWNTRSTHCRGIYDPTLFIPSSPTYGQAPPPRIYEAHQRNKASRLETIESSSAPWTAPQLLFASLLMALRRFNELRHDACTRD